MCGIAGMILDRKVDRNEFKKMLDFLTHRGPDEEGIYETEQAILGIKRLMIIDMETGKQPQHNETGDLTIIFNGEIYNYKEVRHELKGKHTFKTRSDTEVIIHAYEEYGEECVHHFNGMFAFAIWDKKKLFIARDRIGKKPLYYYHKKGMFLFASEIKAILGIVDCNSKIPENLFVFENPLDGETLFEDIYTLPRSSKLIYENNKLRIEKYWDIDVEPDYSMSEKECIEKLRWLIEDAVHLRLRSDVPIGCFLSGGLDSSIITCLAKPERVFICNFPYGNKYDELHYAELVADYVGSIKHIVKPTAKDFQELLPHIIYMLDQPVGTAAPIAEFMLNQEASKYVKVLLSGLGTDEFFGGYMRHLFMLMEDNIVNNPAIKNYTSLAKYFWGDKFFDPMYKRYLQLIQRGEPVTDKPLQRVKNTFSKFKDIINQISYTDFQISLPGLLMMSDRASSAYSTESRSPFLDYRIIEFSYKMPPELKIKNNRTKYIIHKVAEGIVPEPILKRKEKMGFTVPMNHWLSNSLKDWSTILIENLKQRNLNFDMNNDSPRGEFDRKKYQRLSLELWYQIFIDKTVMSE